MQKIVIYSTTTCPYCKMLKDYLTEKGFSFEEKLVDQDDVAKDQMVKESNGFLGVPFSTITHESGTKTSIIGFDKGKIDEILKIT